MGKPASGVSRIITYEHHGVKSMSVGITILIVDTSHMGPDAIKTEGTDACFSVP